MVLELHFFEDLSRAEAAEILQLPPGTVASRLGKAKNELAAQIEQLASTPAQATTTLRGLDGWVAQLRATMGLSITVRARGAGAG
jgi:RNA polymerase sigma-70 factor (ECF subfamily)